MSPMGRLRLQREPRPCVFPDGRLLLGAPTGPARDAASLYAV
jgi:hypothetical protein